MDVRTAQGRAISRAIAAGLAGEVRRVKFGEYRVPSSSRPGQVWTVTVADGRYECGCEAGRNGRACLHAAAVYIRKVEQGGATVVTPTVEAPAVLAPLPAPAPASPTYVPASLPAPVEFLRRAA